MRASWRGVGLLDGPLDGQEALCSGAALLQRLVALRKDHALSQAEVARRMSVSQPTVAGFERYDANPTLSTLRRYALAVGARFETRVVDDTVANGPEVGASVSSSSV